MKHKPITGRIWRLVVYCVNQFRWSFRFASFGWKSSLARPDMLTRPRGISIGCCVHIRKWSRLEVFGTVDPLQAKMVIGDNTSIHLRFHCGAAESVVIGNNVLIASNVFITDHDHDFEDPLLPPGATSALTTAPVIIEDGVWLGENSVILKGVTIGTRSVIGANSVVTRDVPPLTVVGGVPARELRKVHLRQTNETA